MKNKLSCPKCKASATHIYWDEYNHACILCGERFDLKPPIKVKKTIRRKTFETFQGVVLP